MPRILTITPLLPLPADTGSPLRFYHLARCLADARHQQREVILEVFAPGELDHGLLEMPHDLVGWKHPRLV